MFVHIAEGEKTPKFILYVSEHERGDEPWTEINVRAETWEEAFMQAWDYSNKHNCTPCSVCCNKSVHNVQG